MLEVQIFFSFNGFMYNPSVFNKTKVRDDISLETLRLVSSKVSTYHRVLKHLLFIADSPVKNFNDVNRAFERLASIKKSCINSLGQRDSEVVTCKELFGQTQYVALHNQAYKPHRNSTTNYLRGVKVC